MRFLSILAVAAMLSLTGCGGKDKDKDKAPVTPATGDAAKAAADKVAAEAKAAADKVAAEAKAAADKVAAEAKAAAEKAKEGEPK